MTCSFHIKSKNMKNILAILSFRASGEIQGSKRCLCPEGLRVCRSSESSTAVERVESQGTVSRRQRPRQSFIPSAALHFRHCDFQTIPGHTPNSLIFFFQYSKHKSSARIHASFLLFFSLISSCADFLSHTRFSLSVLKPLHS